MLMISPGTSYLPFFSFYYFSGNCQNELVGFLGGFFFLFIPLLILCFERFPFKGKRLLIAVSGLIYLVIGLLSLYLFYPSLQDWSDPEPHYYYYGTMAGGYSASFLLIPALLRKWIFKNYWISLLTGFAFYFVPYFFMFEFLSEYRGCLLEGILNWLFLSFWPLNFPLAFFLWQKIFPKKGPVVAVGFLYFLHILSRMPLLFIG